MRTVLTDEEVVRLDLSPFVTTGDVRAIESAVLAKLADREREAVEKFASRVEGHVVSDWRKAVRAHCPELYPPSPASVKCAICKQDGADLSTGTHPTRDECIAALAQRVEAQ